MKEILIDYEDDNAILKLNRGVTNALNLNFIKKISKSIQKGIDPQEIFDAAIKGKNENMGISMPMRGHASASKDSFTHLHNTLSTKQKRIDSKFERMATDDGLYDSYG